MVVRSALFVELLGGIGDLIFALPAIEAIKRTHPNADLDVITFAPGGELLIGDPRVDRVLYAHRGPGPDAAEKMRRDVSEALKSKEYDLIVCDARHSGLHELIDAQATRRTVTHLWKGAGRDEPIPRLFLRRLREEQVIDPGTETIRARFLLSEEERRVARTIWARLGVEAGNAVVLNVHSGVPVKRWPTEHFVALGRSLAADGWTVVVPAGEAPRVAWDVAERISSARFVPKVGLRVSAAFLATAALVVSGDSGLAHLASAVGAPVLAIYGPTWAGRYGVASRSINLGSPFDCPERQPMNFTTQRCWYSGQCIYSNKVNCCEDVLPDEALDAARRLIGQCDERAIPAVQPPTNAGARTPGEDQHLPKRPTENADA